MFWSYLIISQTILNCRVNGVCLPGKYSNQSPQTNCKDCPTGTYQDLNGQAYCKTCATGTYQDQVGQSSCEPCPSGKYRGGTGASSLTQCISCSGGKYQDEIGKTTYKLCVPGRYQDQVAQSSCKSCASGKYYPSQGLNTPNCYSCPYGRTSNAGASTSSMCTYTCNTQGGSGFPASSCLSTGTLKSDLTIACATIPCVELDCCIQLVPDIPAGIVSTDRSTGLRKVVDDWIAGGTAKEAVESRYGPIENWDTSAVTRMDYLFDHKYSFNADLSKCKFFSSWF